MAAVAPVGGKGEEREEEDVEGKEVEEVVVDDDEDEEVVEFMVEEEEVEEARGGGVTGPGDADDLTTAGRVEVGVVRGEVEPDWTVEVCEEEEEVEGWGDEAKERLDIFVSEERVDLRVVVRQVITRGLFANFGICENFCALNCASRSMKPHVCSTITLVWCSSFCFFLKFAAHIEKSFASMFIKSLRAEKVRDTMDEDQWLFVFVYSAINSVLMLVSLVCCTRWRVLSFDSTDRARSATWKCVDVIHSDSLPKRTDAMGTRSSVVRKSIMSSISAMNRICF